MCGCGNGGRRERNERCGILCRDRYRRCFGGCACESDVQLVVKAALLLACKLEEDARQVKHLIDVVSLLSRAEDAGAEITKANLDDFLIDHDSTVSTLRLSPTLRQRLWALLSRLMRSCRLLRAGISGNASGCISLREVHFARVGIHDIANARSPPPVYSAVHTRAV